MFARSRLLRPLNFLRIKAEGLGTYRWGLPTAFCVIISFYLAWHPKRLPLFGVSSLASILISFLQFLPGFYIASLAAVATFGKTSMEEPLAGSSAKLFSSENGRVLERTLNRRHFLSYLFGYLSFISLVLFAFVSLCQAASPVPLLENILIHWEIPFSSNVLEWFFFVPLLFFFCQMFILTLLGLFYLCDRIHWKGEEKEILK